MEALQDTQVFCKFCVMMPRGTDVSEENIASFLKWKWLSSGRSIITYQTTCHCNTVCHSM